MVLELLQMYGDSIFVHFPGRGSVASIEFSEHPRLSEESGLLLSEDKFYTRGKSNDRSRRCLAKS